MTQQPPVGQDLLIVNASRSHSDTPQSAGLLWTNDQPDAENSTWQRNGYKRETSMSPEEFEPTISGSQQSQIHTLDTRQLASAVQYFNDACIIYPINTQLEIVWILFDVRGSVHHNKIHKENPTRCNRVTKFYSIFTWSSTCFRRHTAHHQEPKTALAASGLA